MTELHEIMERFAPSLDENELSDLSRMCREYAVTVHESRSESLRAELATTRQRLDRMTEYRDEWVRHAGDAVGHAETLQSELATTRQERDALAAKVSEALEWIGDDLERANPHWLDRSERDLLAILLGVAEIELLKGGDNG